MIQGSQGSPNLMDKFFGGAHRKGKPRQAPGAAQQAMPRQLRSPRARAGHPCPAGTSHGTGLRERILSDPSPALKMASSDVFKGTRLPLSPLFNLRISFILLSFLTPTPHSAAKLKTRFASLHLRCLLRNKSSDPELNLPHSPPPWKEHNTQQPGNVLSAQPGQRGTSSMGRERRRGRWQPGGSRMRCLRSTSWCQGHGKNSLYTTLIPERWK